METSSIALLVILVLWAMGFLLLPRLRRCRCVTGSTCSDVVCVIVPERNEEHNLPMPPSSNDAPNLRCGLPPIAWWKLAPDVKHELVTAGFGQRKKTDCGIAALQPQCESSP